MTEEAAPEPATPDHAAPGQAAPEEPVEGAAQHPILDEAPPPPLGALLESLLLSSSEPLSVVRMKEVLSGEGLEVEAAEIRETLEGLAEAYANAGGPMATGLRLSFTAGGWSFRSIPGTGRFVRRLHERKPSRLSRAALETLAIIAYRQPITRPQVDEIRGVDSAGPLRALIEKKLVRVLGKADDVGRPLIYGTTRQFLDHFSLSSLRDLPTLRDYQDVDGGPGPAPTPAESLGLGPVRVMDLFDPERRGELISAETEDEGAAALRALEHALGEAAAVARRAGPGAAGLDGGAESGPESASGVESDSEPGTED